MAWATVDTPDPVVAEGVAEALAAGVADALADGLAVAAGSARARLAISWVPAPAAPGAPAAWAEELADALGDAFAVELALGDGVPDAEALGDGVAAAAAVFGATSSTWRKRSWAVCPTRSTTF